MLNILFKTFILLSSYFLSNKKSLIFYYHIEGYKSDQFSFKHPVILTVWTSLWGFYIVKVMEDVYSLYLDYYQNFMYKEQLNNLFYVPLLCFTVLRTSLI